MKDKLLSRLKTYNELPLITENEKFICYTWGCRKRGGGYFAFPGFSAALTIDKARANAGPGRPVYGVLHHKYIKIRAYEGHLGMVDIVSTPADGALAIILEQKGFLK